MDEPRKRYAGMMSGLDIHYDLGAGHPLLGRRMPDLDLVTERPAARVQLLHDARPVLLNLGEPGGLDIAPWADRVRRIDARYAGAWELPVLGAVAAPTAVLIRPDGYVAWVGDGTDRGLHDALTTWFGPPARRKAHHCSPRTFIYVALERIETQQTCPFHSRPQHKYNHHITPAELGAGQAQRFAAQQGHCLRLHFPKVVRDHLGVREVDVLQRLCRKAHCYA